MSETNFQEEYYGISASFCDFLLEHQLEKLQPHQIVDFGAGAGKTVKLQGKY